MAEQTSSLGQSVLDWLRAGYPEGIPPQDYAPILGVLRRRLTPEEIHAIADGLAAQSLESVDPISRDDIEAMIEQPSTSAPTTSTSPGSPSGSPPAAGRSPTRSECC